MCCFCCFMTTYQQLRTGVISAAVALSTMIMPFSARAQTPENATLITTLHARSDAIKQDLGVVAKYLMCKTEKTTKDEQELMMTGTRSTGRNYDMYIQTWDQTSNDQVWPLPGETVMVILSDYNQKSGSYSADGIIGTADAITINVDTPNPGYITTDAFNFTDFGLDGFRVYTNDYNSKDRVNGFRRISGTASQMVEDDLLRVLDVYQPYVQGLRKAVENIPLVDCKK